MSVLINFFHFEILLEEENEKNNDMFHEGILDCDIFVVVFYGYENL